MKENQLEVVPSVRRNARLNWTVSVVVDLFKEMKQFRHRRKENHCHHNQGVCQCLLNFVKNQADLKILRLRGLQFGEEEALDTLKSTILSVATDFKTIDTLPNPIFALAGRAHCFKADLA